MYAWPVHVTKETRDGPQIQPIAFIGQSEVAARGVARDMSLNEGIVAAAVTRHTLGVEGSRKRVAIYVNGDEQQLPHFTDEHVYVDG